MLLPDHQGTSRVLQPNSALKKQTASAKRILSLQLGTARTLRKSGRLGTSRRVLERLPWILLKRGSRRSGERLGRSALAVAVHIFG